MGSWNLFFVFQKYEKVFNYLIFSVFRKICTTPVILLVIFTNYSVVSSEVDSNMYLFSHDVKDIENIKALNFSSTNELDSYDEDPYFEGKVHKELIKQAQENDDEKIEVIITLNNMNNIQEIEQKIKDLNGEIKQELKIAGAVYVEVPKDSLEQISEEQEIDRLWPNQRYELLLDDSVPYIGAPTAWDLGYNGSGIKIAIIDTGIDDTHEMLDNGKVVLKQDFSGQGTTNDTNGHGTHCAGIAAGNGALLGVAKGADLANVRVGSNPTTVELINAIEWASLNTDILSISLGAQLNNPEGPFKTAINNAINNGAIIIIGAGNCGPCGGCSSFEGVTNPGDVEEVITVGSIYDSNEEIACSSGRQNFTTYQKPEIVAPGVSIISAKVGGGYVLKGGTSMATPHVAGVVALLLQKDPTLTHFDIKALLQKTATDVGSPGIDLESGYGVVNVTSLFQDDLIGECNITNDCGTPTWTGTPICDNNSVYQNKTYYTCNFPDTRASYCANTTIFTLKENCTLGCEDGTCIIPACNNDSECGTNSWINSEQCNADDVYQDYLTYTCNDPGTINATCTNTTTFNLKENCSDVCFEGACYTPSCYNNTQCGTNNWVNQPYCNSTDVFQDYQTFTCLNPGEFNATCTNTTTPIFKQNCTDECYNGSCYTPACNSDPDCGTNGWINLEQCNADDVYQDYLSYTCQDPGTINATCTNITTFTLKQNCSDICHDAACVVPTCYSDSECGANTWIDQPYCNSDDIFQNYKTFTCLNPGQHNAVCTNTTVSTFKQNCTNCDNGSCYTPACNSDSDCGTDSWINSEQCNADDVYQDYISYTCQYPGTINATCENATTFTLKQNCSDICHDAACVVPTCYSDSECGANTWTDQPYCNGDDIFQNYKTFTCLNPGQHNSVCTNTTVSTFKENCTNCDNGSCYDPICNQDSDCGTDSWINLEQCNADDVYQNYISYTCQYPGTINATCENATTFTLKQNCSDICHDATCVVPTCYSDSECGTNTWIDQPYCNGDDIFQNYKTFTCLNPGQHNSVCTNTTVSTFKENCNNCDNGACYTPACNSDSDCGTNGWINSEQCNADDVYQNYISYTCQNPGTINAACTNSIAFNLKQDCGIYGLYCYGGSCESISCFDNSDCSKYDGWEGYPTCKYGDVYLDYATYYCNNKGTPSSSCIAGYDLRLKEECDSDEVCSGGTCKAVECFDDSECGEDYFEYICRNDNLYSHVTHYYCKNSGTDKSECAYRETFNFLKNCLNGCSSGQCSYQISCFKDSDCGSDKFIGSKTCEDNSVYQSYRDWQCKNPGTKDSVCQYNDEAKMVDECNICQDGRCVDCASDNDCSSELSGMKYCNQDNVYMDRKYYECISGECVYATSSPELIETCGGCYNGVCIEYEDYSEENILDIEVYDLTMMNRRFPRLNENIIYRFYVKNTGDFDVSDIDWIFDPDKNEPQQSGTISSLKKGQVKAIYVMHSFTNYLEHYPKITLDPYNIFDEDDETNNVAIGYAFVK